MRTSSTQAHQVTIDRNLTELEWAERRTLARPALLFSDSGKWKYDVHLVYVPEDYFGWGGWDLWSSAEAALARATKQGLSGVSMTQVPPEWMMVVPDPYGICSHPIIVRGERR